MRRACVWLGVAVAAGAALSPHGAAAQSLERALRSVVSVLPDWPPDARRNEEPEGSGVAMLDGRTIVTAAHVVERARSIRVRTASGEILEARFEARDRATDIAILSLDKALEPMPVGAGAPALGEPVCAIGNAFGLGLSVTCGVVSGVHRAGVGFNPVEDFVQTDAAVNPGASGGALVTKDGKFVGLLSAIFTKTSDANIGVNFAVSAGLVAHVARKLKETGRVVRPMSGMRLAPAPDKGATGRLSARVIMVRAGSAAERAGVRLGDLIVTAGGRRIRKPADFVSVMSGLAPAATLDIVVVRDGAEHTLQLRL